MSSIRYLFLFLFVFLFCGFTFADFSVDDFVAQLQTKQATLSPPETRAYYLQVYTNLRLLAIKNRDNTEQVKILSALKDYMQSQIESLGTIPTPPTPFSGMLIPRVDIDRVRDVWLALHNTERDTLWLTPFTYSPLLEWTACTWAEHLADLGITTHKRKRTDGYYSYASIKAWFADQWIVFSSTKNTDWSLFTENIWWNMYSCKKDDCTDDFIKAIKKSRTFFMSEKGRRYRPHYNAIVGNFSTIGLGVSLVGNKYYLVSHYTQALQ